MRMKRSSTIRRSSICSATPKQAAFPPTSVTRLPQSKTCPICMSSLLGEMSDVPLDGLPPLLDAFSRDGIDTVVIGGPAYLEDPNATIIAWSTRNMLWAVEMGHVDSRDAQLAADRLDIAGVAPFGIAVVNRHR